MISEMNQEKVRPLTLPKKRKNSNKKIMRHFTHVFSFPGSSRLILWLDCYKYTTTVFVQDTNLINGATFLKLIVLFDC